MQKTIKVRSDEEALKLFGNLDKNITYAEENFGVKISARGNKLTIGGKSEDIKKAGLFFKKLLNLIRRGEIISDDLGIYAENKPSIHSNGGIITTFKGNKIDYRSAGQEKYLDALSKYDIVFCIGPAGTGKTYLAVASALSALKKKRVSRIVLTRPAVEAGESLGFLPGDMYAKINPYLRPLYDALYEMAGFENVIAYIDRGVIEVAPLAYMRGRTLNDAFIILDEAQNTTVEQMKMFLTRIGFSSKAVITGDVTQIDLTSKAKSGLINAKKVLSGVNGISFVSLNEEDVVRHNLVREIIKAYEKAEKGRKIKKK